MIRIRIYYSLNESMNEFDSVLLDTIFEKLARDRSVKIRSILFNFHILASNKETKKLKENDILRLRRLHDIISPKRWKMIGSYHS